MEVNDNLLIRYLLQEASAEQAKQVEEWRVKDVANEARFEQFRLIWQTSRKLKFEGRPDVRASLHKLNKKLAEQKLQRQSSILRYSNFWIKIAAVILLTAGGTWVYIASHADPKIVLSTEAEVKKDTLSDGSVVTLNRKTTLKYPKKFNGEQRDVLLAKGEAFFNITANKDKPFIISTGGTIIKVLGTSFNVKNKDGNVEVIVETGIVEVIKNDNMLSLKPGEKVLVKKNTDELTKEKNSDKLYTYYRSQELVADNMPLWKMVQILNEAYDVHIVISNKELNNLPLNTTFKNETLNDILQIISRTFKITVEKKHDEIILK